MHAAICTTSLKLVLTVFKKKNKIYIYTIFCSSISSYSTVRGQKGHSL